MVKKTKELAKRPVGRPRLDLDEGLIRRLAWIQCTNEEIAAVMQCSADTIENNYSGVVKTGRLMGKASLRRKQWLAASQLNPALLIWLGKQLLGQRDKLTDSGDGESLDEMLIAMQRARGFSDQHPNGDGEKKPN